jgi:Zn-dependent protease with chaperone function
LLTGRPSDFPSLTAWLSVGMGRSWRGVAAALFGTWFYLPLALVSAVLGAVVLGLVGFFSGVFSGPDQVPAVVADLPLLGAAVDAFLLRSGGVVGGLVGALLGLVLGFLGGLLLLWAPGFADDPVAGAGSMLGVAGAGLLVGALYTLYRVGFEPAILRLSGARRPSRREWALLEPILAGAAHRLRLRNYPPVLIVDDPEPLAVAYTRHIVLSRGLLAALDYHPAAIAGVVCHQLVHWRNADPISAVFVRGVALPLYLVHAAAGWLIRHARHPLVTAVLWLLLWPVMVTVRFFILPAQAADARKAELRADRGAVLAGHRDGLRLALTRLDHRFEGGRNGWTRAASALHPPVELRLERLEDPARRYPLPDPAGAPEPPAPAPPSAEPPGAAPPGAEPPAPAPPAQRAVPVTAPPPR